MPVLSFVLKMIASSGLLYGYYHLFLRNRRFHGYNRYYLLGAVIVSLVLPLLHIPLQLLWGSQPHGNVIRTLRVINVAGWEEPVTIYASRNGWGQWFTVSTALWLVYGAGLATGLLVLLRTLAWIQKIARKYPYETMDKLRLYYTEEQGTPFSFFRSIFWDKKISLQEPRGQQICRHEMFHVQQKHSADVLLMEIACCIAWFNPLFHLLKKELTAIHEFLADEYAVSGNNRYEYAELLLTHAINQKKLPLTTPFFHNQLKRRINMITQSNLIRRSGYISRIMALPLLFVLISSFAVKLGNNFRGNENLPLPLNTITLVVDPGHGGIYPGAHGNTSVEKDLTLAIAQKIKELSPQYNVNTLLTRNADEMVAGATDLKQDLLNRITITNHAKPDAFISLHVNATAPNAPTLTGIQAYIRQKPDNSKDRQLTSAILVALKDVYTVDESIKQRDGNILVLDQNVYPSALIECGYINNPKDEVFFSDPANQEKIARKILEGLVKYATAQQANSTLISSPSAGGELAAAEPRVTDTAPAPGTANKKQAFDSGTRVFTKVEEEAEYPGGQDGWIKFLLSHLKYPDNAVKKNIQGTVVMEFIVNTDGSVSDIKAISGPNELKKPSIQVIKDSGKWIPAKQNGKTVKAYKKQPITYKLS